MYDTHIFLDFEMNPIPRQYKEARAMARAEIVEIGAVKLNADYELVDRFACYVRPEYNTITPRITEITGITQDKVENAQPFGPAMEAFGAWIGEGKSRIYSWSRTDQYQLYDESWLKEYELPCSSTSGGSTFRRSIPGSSACPAPIRCPCKTPWARRNINLPGRPTGRCTTRKIPPPSSSW